MILLFSGTGNSRYVAEAIGAVTGDMIVSMNELIKIENHDSLRSVQPFVFVCPTHAWRIPRIVEAYIRQTCLNGCKKAYFILTCGDETGNAAHYAMKLCGEKNLEFCGLASVVMPENYIAMFKVPDKAEAAAIISYSIPRIIEIAEDIRNERQLSKEDVSLADRLKSRVVNPIFYSMFVSAEGFRSTEACISCGKCSELCPLNNIKLEAGSPQWGKKCAHCMACICGCPTEAIEYKNASKGKPRYYNIDKYE